MNDHNGMIKLGPEGLEINGRETFVKEMWAECKPFLEMTKTTQLQRPSFVELLAPKLKSVTYAPDAHGQAERQEQEEDAEKKVVKKRKSAPSSSSAIEKIDFAQKGSSVKELSDFFKEKAPENCQDPTKVMIFSFFLLKKLDYTSITPEMVLFCFESLGERKPNDVAQIFRDIKAKKGWLTGNKKDGFTLTPKGENIVSHDLPNSRGE